MRIRRDSYRVVDREVYVSRLEIVFRVILELEFNG